MPLPLIFHSGQLSDIRHLAYVKVRLRRKFLPTNDLADVLEEVKKRFKVALSSPYLRI